MLRNLKTPERIIRAVIGLTLLGLFGALEPPFRYLTLVGLIPLGTALTGHCPAYRAFARVKTGADAPGARRSP